MKKISNIIFSLFSFSVLAFVSCNLKKGNESISEKIEITETISVSDNIREVNDNIEKTKPRPRIRELDWYVGNWKEVVNEEYSWFDENPKIPIAAPIQNTIISIRFLEFKAFNIYWYCPRSNNKKDPEIPGRIIAHIVISPERNMTIRL